MTSTAHQRESTAAALYVGVELSAREWLLTMSSGPGGTPVRRRVPAGDREHVRAVLAAAKRQVGLAAEAPVRSCHEAGREGFWPHRLLETLGVTNVVVDSSSIEVNRRLRQAKTDRLDGEKLQRMLWRYWGGERDVWHVVRVPSSAVEDARHASRALTTVQAERTRCRNRIHSLLALHGVRKVAINAAFPARLEALRDWAGAPLPPGVQARLHQTWRILQHLEGEGATLRAWERQQLRVPAPPGCAQRLTQLRGIAARSATILADELFSRQLRNRREVGALAGLVSAPYQSALRRDQGLTRGGVPAVRRVAVEIAWAWLRYQPQSALSRWYQARFGGGGAAARRIGIVALARRVLIALWRYDTTGRVPEGALLKP